MREYSVPPAAVVAPSETVFDDVYRYAAEHPRRVSYSRRVDGRWVGVTCAEVADEVTALAAGLIASGVGPGDRVALFSRTRFEWLVCDAAILSAGAVTVPVYETSSAEQVAWILRDSGAVAAIVETQDNAARVKDVSEQLPALRQVWIIDSAGLEELADAGRDLAVDVVERRRSAVKADDLATIIYTSGTTGMPKGCTITHRNLLEYVRNCCSAEGVREEVFNNSTRTLLFLPLAHILARGIQLAAVHNGVHLAHTGVMADLPAQLQEFRPTAVLSVPRVFEKVYNSAKHKAAAERKGWIFDSADRTALAYSEALDTAGPGFFLRLRHAIFERLVYGKIRAALGGEVRWAVSGGAPLGARLGHFFRGIGLNVLEGYGLTETCSAITLNLPAHQKVGSVGRPIPGCTIRIDDDGEVLVKAGNVFQGYWGNDKATAEVFDDDGWFRTGDLGELDDDGYLTITGRKKDIIVTSAGKNVAPAVLEDRLRAHWLISQCVVVGDARPFIGALITIDPDVFPQWKSEAGKPEQATVADLRDDPDLLAALQEAVEDANKAVSAAEAIKKIRVLPHDFTVETGDLTPTLKVKRNVVLTTFRADVEGLYSG